ncbi:phage baseplate plug family protein [Moellerella wisconsensis]|uniref:phage baseplate plug family protein n=1 Tax=Moellerella wisconsensis TaxID=158849 RepID=UPI003AAB2828
MSVSEIPLSNKNQEFDIQLGGKVYHLRVVFREYCGWILDVMTQSKEEVLLGIPIVHGVDIFEQYRYLGFDGSLFFYCEDPTDELSYSQIGHTNKLYFG